MGEPITMQHAWYYRMVGLSDPKSKTSKLCDIEEEYAAGIAIVPNDVLYKLGKELDEQEDVCPGCEDYIKTNFQPVQERLFQ